MGWINAKRPGADSRARTSGTLGRRNAACDESWSTSSGNGRVRPSFTLSISRAVTARFPGVAHPETARRFGDRQEEGAGKAGPEASLWSTRRSTHTERAGLGQRRSTPLAHRRDGPAPGTTPRAREKSCSCHHSDCSAGRGHGAAPSARGRGIEPLFLGPKPSVLPLDDPRRTPFPGPR